MAEFRNENVNVSVRNATSKRDVTTDSLFVNKDPRKVTEEAKNKEELLFKPPIFGQYDARVCLRAGQMRWEL